MSGIAQRAAAISPGSLTLRPAWPADLPQVVTLLHETIRQSEFYSEDFKSYEVARLSRDYLRILLEIDPWHVAIGLDRDVVVALCLTIPDHGVLWNSWICVTPAYRTRAAALPLIRMTIRHFERRQFDKICCYVRPENRAGYAVCRHFGFKEFALLRRHVFGHDVIMLERPLEKAISGYAAGVEGGRLRRWRLRLSDLFGR